MGSDGENPIAGRGGVDGVARSGDRVGSQPAVRDEVVPCPSPELGVSCNSLAVEPGPLERPLFRDVVHICPRFEALDQCVGEQVVGEDGVCGCAVAAATVLGQ